MAELHAYVATLIANPNHPSITADLAAEAARCLGPDAHVHWLHHEVAADILFHAGTGEGALAELRDLTAGRSIDVVVQRNHVRRKRLFLADMDSTMIAQECIDELADLVGLKPRVAAITERAMRGEIAFEPALRERVALLAGLPVGVADRLIAERITLTPGGRTLVATMQAHGAYACLVSGGFTSFTGPIGAMLSFDETRANRLHVADGHLTGTVEEPILGREAKRQSLLELRARLGLEAIDVLAVGDGANDLAMLAEAGLGVAFRAKPAVAAAAHAAIDHGDLTALLYIQGYTAAEFVGA